MTATKTHAERPKHAHVTHERVAHAPVEKKVVAEKKPNYAGISAAINGLVDDMGAIKIGIERLQNSPVAITPENKAVLDHLESQSSTLASKLEALDKLNSAPAA